MSKEKNEAPKGWRRLPSDNQNSLQTELLHIEGKGCMLRSFVTSPDGQLDGLAMTSTWLPGVRATDIDAAFQPTDNASD